MFGIDEGKNLVADKLYDFFMEPMNLSTATNIRFASSFAMEVGEASDFYVQEADSTHIAVLLKVDIDTSSSSPLQFIVRSILLGTSNFSVSYANWKFSYYNVESLVQRYVLASDKTITLGLPMSSWNTTNVYYYKNVAWRILRIA